MDPESSIRVNDSALNGTTVYAESVEFKATKIVFYFIIICFSTLGNTMVMYTICSSKRMRSTSSNHLILTLAACDLLTPLVSIPLDLALEEHNYQWVYGAFLCKIIWPLSTLLSTASSLTLAAISFDRYRNIMHPFKSRLTPHQIKLTIFSLFLFSLLAVLPYSHVLTLSGGVCREHWSKFVFRQTYTLFLFFVQYAIPLVFMSIMYALALKNLHSSSSRTWNSRSPETAKEKKVIKRLSFTRRMSLMPNIMSKKDDGRELRLSPRPRRFSLPLNKRKHSNQEKIAENEESESEMAKNLLVPNENTVYQQFLHPQDCVKCTHKGKNYKRIRTSLSLRFSLSDIQEEQNLRATKMFIGVVVVFAIFMFPNQIAWLWADFGGGHQAPHFNQATIICWLFTYTNSVCNWIIYAFLNKEFRSGFKKIFNKFKVGKCPKYRGKDSVRIVSEGGSRSTCNVTVSGSETNSAL